MENAPVSPPQAGSSNGANPASLAATSSGARLGAGRRRRKLNGATTVTEAASSIGGGDATIIKLPSNVPLPITIARICVPEAGGSVSRRNLRQTSSEVRRGTALFDYYAGLRATASQRSKGKGKALAEDGQLDDEGPPLVTFDSPADGTLEQWSIAEGQVLREEDGWRNRQILTVREPCTHAVQWQGQCAICGKDLTTIDYTGVSDTQRATLAVSHSTTSLTVSLREAQRLDSETKTRLLGERKLSLIVDLDQTIVHATVDPTVGEWMEDKSNPNWEVLQGVGKFQLADPMAPPGTVPEADQCWYYLKKRPGLDDFLKQMAKIYEMHIYTMGTRAYATAVCKLIDPTGELFGGRILSRDESGSLTQKSLTRLFPVDTSMVVVIDDRADVWEHSPNLVAVFPYNFFVGIGDINGAFLPRREAQLGSTPPPVTPTVTITPEPSESPLASGPPEISEAASPPEPETPVAEPEAAAGDERGPSQSPSTSGAEVNGLRPPVADSSTSAATAQSQVLSEQLQVRPLKKRQEELEAALKERKERRSARSSVNGSSRPSTPSSKRSSRANTPTQPSSSNAAPPSPTTRLSSEPSTTADSQPAMRLAPPGTGLSTANVLGLQTTGATPVFTSDVDTETEDDDSDDDWMQEAVLVDRDSELTRLAEVLGNIHDGFYSQDYPENSDTREVISAFKSEALIGVQIAFSSCWPMNAIAEEQDRWKQARDLGAQCVHNIGLGTTHLVAARFGTAKVNEAFKRRDIYVVVPQWLIDAALYWKRPNEQEYLWRRDPALKIPESLPAISDDEQDVDEAFDWKGASDEVMAFLDDTDNEDQSDADLDLPDGAASRKRTRTSTASTDGNDEGKMQGESPLSKRQRLARARSSKLKLSVGDAEDDDAIPASAPPSSSFDDVSNLGVDDEIDLDALDQELFSME